MKPKVLFVLFDAGDADTLDAFAGENLLPRLERIREEGGYSKLKTLEHSLAESTQVSLFTGARPEIHGFYGPQRFDPSNYSIEVDLTSGFNQMPPFFDLGDDIDVLTFDLPMCPILTDRPYTQIVDWGNHGFAVGGSSSPPEAWRDLMEKVGPHPEHGIDFALLGSQKSCSDLFERQLKGIELRSRATRYLMDKYSWDLALTSTSESHTGPHYLMRHPGNESFYDKLKGRDPIREIYAGIDTYLGDLIDHTGPDTEVLIASIEGMSTNHSEVPNIAYLPEMLFRYSFPGKRAFEYDSPLPPLPDDTPDEVIHNWVVQASRRAILPGKLQKSLRDAFSESTAMRIERLIGLKGAPFKPESRPAMNYQPNVWIEPYWPHMRAFSLPTFSDGFVRLNVKGREARGVIQPADFSAEVERICQVLQSFRCEKTEVPAIDRIEVVRTRPDENPDRSPADLIVFWKDQAIEVVVSGDHGKIGPLPGLRAGVHNDNAFVFGCGPRLSKGGFRTGGHILDLAPTVLDLLGRPPQGSLSGSSLLASSA